MLVSPESTTRKAISRSAAATDNGRVLSSIVLSTSAWLSAPRVAGILAADWRAGDKTPTPNGLDIRGICPDLSLYDKFNEVYKSYFSKDYPARAFVGSGPLLRGGHFEINAMAIKR